ncbi:hypothetical protein PENARI_c001G04083 [Penicillium arizonense]|uniref:Transcription factor domain-containing protein n=1 Tax=Penicillium arizonense TaxID=1835702 RepID=A0A1F5LZ74_PENAI|nr:hypothetical protein PENARI_c001G04083 [Penicillium arizonense]OGE58424.1 hypothetical protein PENARI_c001G04083 [Penicillium arizonense]
MAAALQTPRALCSPDSRISITNYCTVLDIFQLHLYDIWPIVDAEDLKSQLCGDGKIDPSSHALAAALCAATLAQTRLQLTQDPCPEGLAVTVHEFAKECLRVRLEHSYNQAPSLQALVTSIFLHMYYANQDQVTPATISLREAITYADLMHLCRHVPPDATQSKQWQLELRCYWILFITERTFCIQHDLPITLYRTPNLPEVEHNSPKGDLYAGFCTLVQLFHHIQHPLALPATTSKAIEAPEIYTKNKISDIQRRIGVKLPGLELKSEIQYVDILTTSAWIRSLLWQYSASHFMLSSATSIEPLSFDYPLSIARDYLASISHVSIESVRSHGYGMEIKLLQVANPILDLLLCMPNLLTYKACPFGPLDAVIAIEQLLLKVGGSKSERLGQLHQRLRQVPSMVNMPLMLESPKQEDELDDTLAVSK